ncbi:Alpha/Beta hydrolase protein [Chytriomyces sp. MP71]|nr:Alpha/Beta hydrolase protein [Chytriomyces sp. MP71]
MSKPSFAVTIPLGSNEWLSSIAVLDSASDSIDRGNGRRMALFCHGISAHKDSPRLFASLAQSIPIASLRFDFRGCGDSSGSVLTWTQYYDALDDVEAVAKFLEERGWRVDTLVGHSMGSLVALLFTLRNPSTTRYFVNMSGRFHMTTGLLAKLVREGIVSRELIDSLVASTEGRETLKEGAEIITVNGWRSGRTLNGETVKGCVVPHQVNLLSGLKVLKRLDGEIATIQETFQSQIQTITIHGTLDETVPVEDADSFARVLPRHALVLVDGGNHNFTHSSHAAFAVDTVVSWFRRCEEVQEAGSKLN